MGPKSCTAYEFIPVLLVRIVKFHSTIEMQSFGSQEWDTAFALQALLASGLTDEIEPTLSKGHDFVKQSQVST